MILTFFLVCRSGVPSSLALQASYREEAVIDEEQWQKIRVLWPPCRYNQ